MSARFEFKGWSGLSKIIKSFASVNLDYLPDEVCFRAVSEQRISPPLPSADAFIFA